MNSTYPIWTTPHHRGDASLAVLEQYVGLRGQKRIAFVDRVGRVFHYDLSEVRQDWGGTFRVTNVDPEWEESVRRFITRPRRPRTLAELKRASATTRILGDGAAGNQRVPDRGMSAVAAAAGTGSGGRETAAATGPTGPNR
jgi:hypothetical protein